MTKHLRLAVAAFSAVALLLAGCADDDGATDDTLDTEQTDVDEGDDLLEDEDDA